MGYRECETHSRRQVELFYRFPGVGLVVSPHMRACEQFFGYVEKKLVQVAEKITCS